LRPGGHGPVGRRRPLPEPALRRPAHQDGQFVREHLRREGLDEEEVLMAIREHGVADVKDVRMAVLETDGSISIVPADAKTMRSRRHARFTRRP